MRNKSYLLGFVCIVITSILLIGFGDQRPSLQSIVTETHKQLKNNLHNFKESLRDVQEKRLQADEKYLSLLGFNGSPRLYPDAIWRNTSLPVVVSYLLEGSANQGVGLARNIAHCLPNSTLLLYNLGLSRGQLQTVSAYCNSSRCIIIDFKLSDFPSHVVEERLHAFRPLVIQDALNRAGAVLFLECDLRLISGQAWPPLVNVALGDAAQPPSAAPPGLVAWATRRAVTSLTHPRMFEYFRTTDDSFLFLPMVDATRLLVFNTRRVHKEVMLPWVQCALIHDCILPIGAQSVGCRFDKKPQYRYSGCHSYDSSALNIVLGLRFDFDDELYTYHGSSDTFFRKVSTNKAALELAALQENSTDFTTLIS